MPTTPIVGTVGASLPRDYHAFKTQRHRWAAGGVQIVRKHWKRFLPGTSFLYHDQKQEYLLGWLSWLGAETIAVAAALLNLVWVPFIALGIVAIPDKILTLPIIAAYAVALAHFGLSYRLRVRVPFWQMIGAMLVFMSVQWTVATAVASAVLRTRDRQFHRTRKGVASGSSPGRNFPARGEAVLGALLVIGAIVLLASNIYRVIEIDVFAAVLLLQALPFVGAAAIASFEYLGINDLASRRAIERMCQPSTRPGQPGHAAM